ncbi:MAG TPA: phosphatase PAP2 family protein [Geothrix sp.]|nr:phosphatase PAP2 family protein [Geothrix sp.]
MDANLDGPRPALEAKPTPNRSSNEGVEARGSYPSAPAVRWPVTTAAAIPLSSALPLLDTHVRDESQRLRSPGSDKVAEVSAEHDPEPWVQWFAFGLATLVGAARIERNAHFASDVVGGALIGTLRGRTTVRRNQERRGGLSKLEVSLEPDFGRCHQGVSLA